MSNILNQRHLLEKRYFEITGDSLKISVTRPFKHYEEEISFEEIGKKIFKKKTYNRYALIGSIISLIGMSVTIFGNLTGDKTISIADIFFYVVLAFITFGLLYMSYANTTNLMLIDKRYIAFYGNIPNKHIVNEFFNLIVSEQKAYMLNKYAKREPFLSLEKLMDQLIWLKDRGIINKSEFEDLKISLFPSTSGNATIGFKFNSSED